MITMMINRAQSVRLFVASVALLAPLALAACDSEPPAGIQPPAQDELAAMNSAIQDEYHAEAVYLGVLADFGEVLPFYNIVFAEQRHSETIASLFVRRGLDVPSSDHTVDNVPRFDSVPAACAVAVEAEVANIEMYDLLLEGDLAADVRRVFQNNRRASLDHHLLAFEACR